MYVVTCRTFVVFVHFTQQQLVLALTKWVPEHSSWMQVHVRVRAFRLSCARTIEVPNRAIYNKEEIPELSLILPNQSTFTVLTYNSTLTNLILLLSQIKMSLPSGTCGSTSSVRVFERRTSPEPSIQMYSTWTMSSGCGMAMYEASTVRSSVTGVEIVRVAIFYTRQSKFTIAYISRGCELKQEPFRNDRCHFNQLSLTC